MPKIRIVKCEPDPVRAKAIEQSKLKAKDMGKEFKKFLGLDVPPQPEFLFGLTFTAGAVMFTSSTRWETEDDAKEGARRIVDELDEFFLEFNLKEFRRAEEAQKEGT